MTDWALSFAYWLHMVATVTWIGSLGALALVVLPAASQTLEAAAYANLLERIQRRLDPLAWLSLMVLAATGMFQMSASPHYQGLLVVTNRWAVAILAKHLVILAMVVVSAYLTWGILPGLRRAAFLRARNKDVSAIEPLQKSESLLLNLNLILGLIVLALTAIARAA